MLRQAMDAAEGLQQQQNQQQNQNQQQQEESASLLYSQQVVPSRPLTHESEGYGTTSRNDDYDEDDDDDEEEDESLLEDSYADDDWSDSQQQHRQQQPPGMVRKTWDAIKSVFVLVANVENLWDSPVPTSGSGDVETTSNRMHNSRTTTNSNTNYNSPYSSGATTSAATSYSDDVTAQYRRRSYLVVLFWFFVLALSYATERSTFKLLVDRAGPFRLFSVEMVTVAHAMMLGTWMSLSNCYHNRHQDDQNNNSNSSSDPIPLGIPMVDVGYMALLDTFHLLLVFLTGRFVCPTLTVILVQFTLPLSAFLTQFVHSDGRCARFCCLGPSSGTDDDDDNDGSAADEERAANEEERQFGSYQGSSNNNAGTTTTTTTPSQLQQMDNLSNTTSEGMPLPGWGGLSAEHLWGSLILSIAVVLALLPSVYTIINPAFFIYADQIPIQTAYNTLIYVSSCFPAAASQLYKEHVFLQNKQPVNASYLNFLLSLFQFILASLLSPLMFGLQGLGAGEDWTTLYPSSHFSNNFLAGLKCFLGLLPEDAAQNDFPEPAKCHFSMGLVLIHAFSIIAVGCAVDKIVNAGATKAMYRGISAGIIVAVLLMYEYDMHIPRFNYGPAIDALNLVCLILLVVGAEVYHRVSLTDAAFETVYPPVDGLYEDEE